MKRLILIALILSQLGGLQAQQQLVNGSFEDTVVTGQQSTMFSSPRFWTNSGFGAGISTDAVEGKFAAYIWNWYYYGKGVLTNGASTSADAGGTPITFRPEKLTGYFKYIAGDVKSQDDSALVFIALTRYNATSGLRDTIGYGEGKFGSANTYKPFETLIQYRSSATPDTVVVRFLSSEKGFCNSTDGNCLYLYLDDIKLSSATTGIAQNLSGEMFSAYPNPAADMLNIDLQVSGVFEAAIYNGVGQVVWTGTLLGNHKQSIPVSHLPAGIYHLRVAENETRTWIKQ